MNILESQRTQIIIKRKIKILINAKTISII